MEMAYYEFQQEFDGSQPPILPAEQRAAGFAFNSGTMTLMAFGIQVLHHDINGAGGRTSAVNLHDRTENKLVIVRQAVEEEGELFASAVELIKLAGGRIAGDCLYELNTGDEQWLRHGHALGTVYRTDDPETFRGYTRLNADGADGLSDFPHHERTRRRPLDSELPVLNNAPVGLAEVTGLFDYLRAKYASSSLVFITERESWRLRGRDWEDLDGADE